MTATKRLALLLCLAALASTPAIAQDTAIAERLAAQIRTDLPGATVAVPDPQGLDITFGGQTRSVGIGSVHEACARGAADCDAAIRAYAQRAASYMLEAAPVSRDQLRIVVRTRSYLDSMIAQIGSAQNAVVEPLAGDLVSVCYRDLPAGRRPIFSADLTTLQLNERTALTACKANSRSALPPLASLLNALPPQGIGVLRTGDDVTGYVAAPGEWQALAAQLGGLVIAVPSTDTVLYGRGANAIDVDALATVARQMNAQAPTPVSAQVLRWTARGWVAAQP